MPYLQAVSSEILRFYAPVPQTLREAAHDTTILNQFIPKGTRIVIAPWATNRCTKLWGADAQSFNPDRWLYESTHGGAESKYGFLSFLQGPTGCIGQGFARAELACLLAGWVGSFEFELRDGELMDERNVDVKGGLTARPAGGLYVKAKRVEEW
jgi:cytochrome P450